ncbi:MAG: restriction endonuclease subunit S [Methylococcales bacterium]|nr:restriction endonuclease subunit S [Methylococcales bacterium]
MKIKFDVTPKELVIVRDILAKYLQEDCTVWIFGSRAKSSSLVGYDLDLALECKTKIALKLLTQLKIAFEDSRLPYRVDIVDMKAVKPYFKEIIDKEKIVFPLKAINKKVPVLRFPEFSGDWEVKKLGTVADFSKGKGISKSDIDQDGILECIRYGELYTHYGETIKTIKSKTNLNKDVLVLSKYNDVIIPASGETQLDIATASCVLKNNVALSGDLNIIRTKLNGVFLSYYLNNRKKHDIASLSQGVSVVHLYATQLKSLSLNLPLDDEQQKIAAFLTQIDRKIEQLSHKKQLLERYKKGVMQKVFSQALRFKDDNGNAYPDWEVKKLGEVATFYSGGTPLTTKKQYYTGNIPFIKSGEISKSKTEQFISKEGLNSSSARMVNKGDILYALYGATSGEVAVSKINGAINQAVLCIKSEFNHYFIYYWLRLKKEVIVSTFIQGGQGNLSANIVKSLKINLPSLEEQTKIANFLTELDNKISLVEKQLNGTKEYKKGLLQKMFV